MLAESISSVIVKSVLEVASFIESALIAASSGRAFGSGLRVSVEVELSLGAIFKART